jgi:CHAD domain-containing protein
MPVLLAGPDLVRRRYRRLRRAGDPLDENSPPEALHRLRIRGKRLRYSIEFLQSVYGKPAARLINRLTDMQDVLGAYQDAQVATEQVRHLAEERDDLPASALFVLGRIAERYRLQGAEQRSKVSGVYRRVRGKRWRRLRRAMDRRREELEARRPPRPPRTRPEAQPEVMPVVTGRLPA